MKKAKLRWMFAGIILGFVLSLLSFILLMINHHNHEVKKNSYEKEMQLYK